MAFGAQIKLSVDKSNKSEFRGQIQQAVNAATSNNPIKIKNVKIDLSAQQKTQLVNQLRDAMKDSDLTLKIAHIDASAAVDKLRRELTTMLSGLSITGLKEFLGDTASAKALGDATEKAAKQTEALAKAHENVRQNAAAAAAATKELNTLQSSLDSANKKLLDMGTGDNVTKLKEKYRELTAAIQDANTKTGEAQAEAVRNASAGVSSLNQEIAAIKKAEQAEKDKAAAAKKAAQEAKRAEQEEIANENKRVEGLRKIDSLLDQINKKISSNPKTKSAYGDQIDALISKLRTLRSETESGLFNAESFAALRGEYQKILTNAGETGNIGRTAWNILAEGWEKFGTWTVITRSMTIAVNTIKKMVSAVKEVDKAMTELRKVTDLTASSYDKLYQRVANTSREIGASVSDMINAVADFARLGFSVADSEQLAKAAVVYKNVGDGIDDISQATESIISTMKAFGIEASDAMRIVDEFNEVGNKFAISSTGIGDALQRSAASLAAAGNTLEQSIGLIVAANNVIQNPETVGTSLKTISMYLRAAKTEAEEAGIETEGMAESVSKLREELLLLTNQKVDIQIDENTFKSTYQILKELANVWSELSDISRANIMEKLGGKRGGNVVSALITNFSDAEAAMGKAMDSVGSALEENDKWLNSIEGRTERVSAAFQKMSNAVLSSNLVGVWVSVQEALADVVTALKDINVLFPLLFASITAILPLVKTLAHRKTFTEGLAAIGIFSKTTAGKIILALSAIAAAIGIISKISEQFSYESRVDAANSKVNELKQQYEETEDEIKSLNTELDETINRMNELSRKESLTIVEKGELETLKSTNAELSARIKNLKRLAQIQNRELAEGIKSAYETEYKTVDKKMQSEYYKISKIVMSAEERSAMTSSDLAGIKVYGLVDQEHVIERAIEWYSRQTEQLGQLSHEIERLEQESDDSFKKRLQEEQERVSELEKDYRAVEEYLSEQLEYYQSKMEEYAKYSDEDETYRMLKAQANAISRALDPDLYKEESYNKIINSDEFVKDVEKIRAVQQEGNEVTAETIAKYEDLSVALQEAGFSLEEAAEQFNATATGAKTAAEAISTYTKIAENIGKISTASESVNKIFGDQGYGSSLTIDQYNKLIEADKDFAKCIENTNGYMQLNIQAARELVAEKTALEQANIAAAKSQKVEEYKKNTDAIAAQQLALTMLKNRYDETSDEYSEYSQQIQNTILSLSKSNVQILEEIQGYERLASELDYATSAYKRWIDAQNSPEAGDDYDNLRTAVSQLKAGLENGKIGTNVFKSAAELLIPDWNEGDTAAVKNYMDKLERYFTEDAQGLQNFIDDMFKNGILDDGGDSYLFKAGTTIEQIADKMGLTVDAARYMVQALQDYGWDVSVINDKYNTADLIAQYEAATATVEEAKAALDQLVDSGASEESVAEQTQKLAEAEQKAAEAKAALNEATGEAPKTEVDLLREQLEQIKEAYETLSDLKIGGTVDEEFNTYINNIQSTIDLLDSIDGAFTIDITPGEGVEDTISTLEKVRENVQAIADKSEINVDVTETISDDVIGKIAKVKEGVEAVAEMAQTNPSLTITTDNDLNNAAENAQIIKEAIDALEELGKTDVAPHTITINMAGDFYDKLQEIQNVMEQYNNGSTTFGSGESTFGTNDRPKTATNAERDALEGAEKVATGYSNILKYMLANFVSSFNKDLAAEMQDVEKTAKGTSDKVFAEVKEGADGTVEIVSKETGEVIQKFSGESGKLIEESTEEGLAAGFANAQVDSNNWVSPPIDIEVQADTEKAEEAIDSLGEKAQAATKKYYEYDTGLDAIRAFEAELKATNGNIDQTLANLGTTWQTVLQDYVALQDELDGIEINPDINEEEFKTKISELYGYTQESQPDLEIGANTSGAINSANKAINTINGKSATFKVYGKYAGTTGLPTLFGLTRFATGVKDSEEQDAMVGDGGPETWIHDGQYRTVGLNGPEIVHLEKGDTILTNKQTKKLFGRIGKFSGNAYASGLNNYLTLANIGGAKKSTSGSASSNGFASLITTVIGAVKDTTETVLGNIKNAVRNGDLKTTGGGEKNIYGDKTGNKNNNNGPGGADPKKIKEEYEEIIKQLEHLIEHQEFLYKIADRGLDFPGMEASLQEQARLYREIMESAYEAVDKMKAQGMTDTDEELQDMERAAWSAYESMYDAFDKIRALYTDSLHEKIDDIQTGYNNLKNVMDEIKDNGGISVDTFQALAEHGLQYLSFLQDANGQYKINTDAVKNMVAAEKEQLAIETALSYISSIREALQDGQENRIDALVDATQQISDNSWSAVYAQAALLKDMGLTGDQYDQVIFNINALKDLSGQVITDLSTGAIEAEKTVKEVFQETKNELDHLIEHQEQLYAEAERGLDFGGMEASLREQARIYKQIMDEAYAAVEEMKRQGMTDTDEDLQEMERAAWAAYASMNDAFDQMRALYTEALHEKLDNIQKGYEDLKNVMDEMAEQGGITVDTFQELAEHGLQYMSFLRNADGQYEINTERIQALVAAEKEQLAVETALSYVNSIQEALSEGQLNRVNALVDATQQIGDNTWNAVYAQAAMLKSMGLTQEQYEQVIFNIQTMQNLAGQVITDIADDGVERIKKQYDDLNSGLEHLIEHQQFLYTTAERGIDYDGMANSLHEQARLYKQIMENAYEAVEEMKRQGMTDLDADLQEMERKAWSAYSSMYDAFDKLRELQTDALHDKIDGIQGAYRNLKDAMDELSETGGISLDTFQALTRNGLQYMSFLDNVNGQYVINTETIQKMIEVEKEQLAIETALSYLSSLHEALENGEENKIDMLVNASQQISDNTWSAVYAQAALLRTMGLTDAQYDQVIYNIEAMRSLASQVVTDISDKVEENYDDQQAALDKILDYTKELVKSEVQGRIKAIEKEIKAYQKIIDKKKESLQLSKDQDKYDRDVADKVTKIAKLQSQIDLLALDDSRSAQAERTKLIEELAELQGDLTDYQAEHAYQAQVDTLDKMSEAYAEERQKEIDILENSISSAEKIYQLAIEKIRTSWKTLYSELIEWNTEQGNVINQEITENWNLAAEAVQRYGSYLRALQDLGGYDVGGTLAVVPKYHTGGIVGEAGSINDDEAMAVLKKGEIVLDDTKKKGLYKIIDFQKVLSEKLATVIGNISLAGNGIMQSMGIGASGIERNIGNTQNMVYSPTINVAISHNGSMSDGDARRYGKDVADTALDRMYSAFERRGIGGIFGTRLKQV